MKFSEEEIPKALDRIYGIFRDTSAGNPRIAESKGLSWTRNSAWFSSDTNKHLEAAAPPKHISSLMRFRLGCCSELRVHDHTIPNRSDRYCTACFEAVLAGSLHGRGTKYQDDEYHMIFECVRFNSIRSNPRWASLFSSSGQNMKVFMNQDDKSS